MEDYQTANDSVKNLAHTCTLFYQAPGIPHSDLNLPDIKHSQLSEQSNVDDKMDPLTHNSTSFWMKLDHCIQTQGRKRADVLYSLDWLLEVRIILISEFQKFYEGNLRWVHLQSEVQRTAKSDNKRQL